MKLAKQLFFFYGWAGLLDLKERTRGGWERERKKRREKRARGETFSYKAQGCRGMDFPKFLIKAHHLPSFLCSFHHGGAINLSSLFVCHGTVVNLITCSCEGCWETEMEGEWERKKERGGAWGGGGLEFLKKSQEAASSGGRKKRSDCSRICLHPLIKGINVWIFFSPLTPVKREAFQSSFILLLPLSTSSACPLGKSILIE